MSAPDTSALSQPQAPAPMPAPEPTDQTPAAAGTTPSPALGASPAAAGGAAPAMPIWRQVVVGALQGMAGSAGQKHFGGGLAAGAGGVLAAQQQARENAIQQQQADTQKAKAQSDISFQSAQAANSVAEAAKNNAIAANMPQEARDAHEKSAIALMGQMQDLGITPSVIADDTNEGAHGALQALNQAGAAQGGVPHIFNIEVGGQHLAYDLSQLSGTPQGLAIVNQTRQMQGQDPVTAAQWKQTPKAAQAQASENALNFMNPPPSKNAGEATGKLSQYQAVAKAYAVRPNADPEVVKKLNGIVSNLSDAKDALVGTETKIAGAKAAGVQAATEPGKQSDKLKEDVNKIWNDPAKGYASALAQANQTMEGIKAGADGNGLLTSMAPTMEVLGINHAAGISRISPQEAAAAGAPGGFAEKWNAWATKAADNKLSPQLASEGKQLMGIVIDAAHNKAVQQTQFAAANRGVKDPSSVGAMDRNGNVTTLDKASQSANKAQARTGEVPVRRGSQIIGYTSDGGKSMRSLQ